MLLVDVGLMTRLKGHGRSSCFTHATHTLLYRVPYPLGGVRRLLRRARHFMFVVGAGASAGRAVAVAVVVPVLVVERLQREAPVCLLAPSAPLGNVRIVLAHCFGFIDLKLSI